MGSKEQFHNAFGNTSLNSHQYVDVANLITAASNKQTTNPLVIFVDLNLPVTADNSNPLPWNSKLRKTCDNILKSYGNNPAPFNLIIFTNRSFHYRLNELAISDPPGFAQPMYSKNQLNYPDQTLGLLIEAVQKYGKIPTEFPASYEPTLTSGP